jgi:hypothetical protein
VHARFVAAGVRTVLVTGEMGETERRAALGRMHERNPRTHSEAQVDQIAASMVEFGWTNPVLVDGKAACWLATAGCSRRGSLKSSRYRLSASST